MSIQLMQRISEAIKDAKHDPTLPEGSEKDLIMDHLYKAYDIVVDQMIQDHMQP